jgi:hypothetical protein
VPQGSVAFTVECRRRKPFTPPSHIPGLACNKWLCGKAAEAPPLIARWARTWQVVAD